jgi:hypothetical protein
VVELVETTRSRVDIFINKFKRLGFVITISHVGKPTPVIPSAAPSYYSYSTASGG